MTAAVANLYVTVNQTTATPAVSVTNAVAAGDVLVLIEAGAFSASGDHCTSFAGLGGTWTKVTGLTTTPFDVWVGIGCTGTGSVTGSGGTLLASVNRKRLIVWHLTGVSGTVSEVDSTAAIGTATTDAADAELGQVVLGVGFSSGPPDNSVSAYTPTSGWSETANSTAGAYNLTTDNVRYVKPITRVPAGASESHTVSAVRSGANASVGILVIGDPYIEPPGIPTSVSVTDADSTNLELTWSAPASGGTVTGYDVRVDGGSASTGTSPHDFTGLTPGTSYTLGVRSVGPGGSSAWVEVAGETDYEGPLVPYEIKVRVGAHVWEIESGDAADGELDVLAGAKFSWSAPDDVGWPPPRQAVPRDLVQLRIRATDPADVGDVAEGDVVRFKFTPEGYLYAAPLIDFAGRVAPQGVSIVDDPQGGVILQITAVDYLADLANWSAFPGGGSGWTLWDSSDPRHVAVTDLCALLDSLCDAYSGYPFPAFGDILDGLDPDDYDQLRFGDLDYPAGTPVTALKAFSDLGLIPWANYDDDGDLDPTHPFLYRPLNDSGLDYETAPPVDAALVPNSSWTWRRGYTPNYLETGDGSTFFVGNGQPGVTEPPPGPGRRIKRFGSSFTDVGIEQGFNVLGFENEVPEDDPWGLYQFLVRAWTEPLAVQDWCNHPHRYRQYVSVDNIAANKDPNGTGSVAGMLKGATFDLAASGRWTITAGMRRSHPYT